MVYYNHSVLVKQIAKLSQNQICLTLFRGFSSRIPIIACKNTFLNYYGNTFAKDDDVPLASRAWSNRKSVGDYFIIHKKSKKKENDEFERNISFKNTELNDEVINALLDQYKYIKQPNNIQRRAIKHILNGKNVLLAAETGCGKTLGYLLPVLHHILFHKASNPKKSLNAPFAIIVAPSRELALQIESVAEFLCQPLNVNFKCVTGGRIKKMMLNPIYSDTDLLIASFGALSKLVTTGIYKLNHLHHIILDEADTLLDDSFSGKLCHFLKKINFYQPDNPTLQNCQLIMASATMPKTLPEELNNCIDTTSIQNITSPYLHQIKPNIPHRFLRLGKSQKPFELLKLLRSQTNLPAIIFTNQTSTSTWIHHFLNENNIKSVPFNSDIPRDMKIDIIKQFHNGDVDIISCTDMGSRGLDTTRAIHVINYDFPFYCADYVHRCGRIGRVGSPIQCFITNFISSTHDIPLVQKIERSVRTDDDLPSVDGNITKLIGRHFEKLNMAI